MRINVLNLSIGGPDFHDQPFIDKVSAYQQRAMAHKSRIAYQLPFSSHMQGMLSYVELNAVRAIASPDYAAYFPRT
jgi:hypothetical protein